MTVHEIINSEDFIDLRVEYTEEIDNMVKSSNDIFSFHNVAREYGILYIHKDRLASFLSQMTGRIKYDFPAPMGILDNLSLGESGIEYIHSQPYVQLRGLGVAIGIIDTGIDYTHPAFIKPNNTTKILRIWDQTIEGTPPTGLHFGHEYTSEDINRALQSSDPLSIVKQTDVIGHGTFLSGIAAGYDKTGTFKGVAPDADLIIVKVKPAKQNLKDYWMILKEDALVYQSTDIMLGLRYVIQIANLLQKPLVATNSFGTSQGPHDGSGISSGSIEDISHRRGFAVVSAAGNEGIAGHHISGIVSEQTKTHDIELKIGNNEKGCMIEIWIPAPDIMSVLVRSPLNEYVEMIPERFISNETRQLLFEKTEITIEYDLANFRNGDQVIFIKLREPTPGIWTITLRSHVYLTGKFDAWLPLKTWIEEDTYFLDPDPNCTVTMPGSFSSVITVGAYDHRDGSLFIESGRGPSRIGYIRPDLVAPGVNIGAPGLMGDYASFSGTSAATAIVAGSAALLLEWGIVREKDPSMNTYKVRNYLIGGARREKNILYPNNIWGYGKLDLRGAFNMMRF